RFRYVIVEEYQDTHQAQLEMLRLLAGDHKNLCVVGDDDQASYVWRGTDVRNILDFEKHFSGTKTVRLEHNYRSKQAVLDVANAVLEASTGRRHEKRLIPTQGEGNKVKLVVAPDGTAEARFVAEEIFRLIDAGTAKPSEVAVLYRSNLQAPEIDSELRARGVVYQLFGGNQTFEKKEVKDLLAYLQVALDPGHELAVRRSLNYPPRGLGDAAIAKLASHATAHDTSLMGAVEKSHAVSGLSAANREGCREYLRVIEEIKRGIYGGTSAPQVIKALATTIGLKQAIFAESGQNAKAAARRMANVGFLLRAFERREEKGPLDADGWKTFLRMLLLREDDDEERGSKVT